MFLSPDISKNHIECSCYMTSHHNYFSKTFLNLYFIEIGITAAITTLYRVFMGFSHVGIIGIFLGGVCLSTQHPSESSGEIRETMGDVMIVFLGGFMYDVGGFLGGFFNFVLFVRMG